MCAGRLLRHPLNVCSVFVTGNFVGQTQVERLIMDIWMRPLAVHAPLLEEGQHCCSSWLHQ